MAGSVRTGLLMAVLVFVLGAVLLARAAHWFELDHWRDDIQAKLSEVAGQPVRVGHLDLSWQGLSPHLRAQDLSLGGSGADAIRIARVDVNLALRALWGGQWKFRSIEARGLDLSVERLSATQFRLAGRVIDIAGPGESRLLEWLMSQPSAQISESRLHLIDVLSGQRTEFDRLRLTMRNGLRTHQFKLEGHQPEASTRLFDVSEAVVEIQTPPGVRKDDWKQWKSDIYVKFDGARVEGIRNLIKVWAGIEPPLAKGQVDVQFWLNTDKGRPRDAQLKFAAQAPALSWPGLVAAGNSPYALELQSASGFASVSLKEDGTALFKIFSAELVDKKGTQVAVTEDVHEVRVSRAGELVAGKVALKGFDAASLLDSLRAMPLPKSVLSRIAPWDIRGQVRSLAFQWDTPRATAGAGSSAPGGYGRGAPARAGEALVKYSARADFERLGFAIKERDPASRTPGTLHIPAFSDVSGSARIDETGGVLELDSQNARLSFPGLFEDPNIAFDRLQGVADWKLIFEGVEVRGARINIPGIQFANADAAGEIRGTYRSGGKGAGLVDLTAHLSRGVVSRTVRYLPVRIPQPVREWVGHSVTAGQAHDVRVRLKGDLWDFPYREPGSGEFLIRAKVQGGELNYAPGWPGLKGFNGELKFQNAGMDIQMDGGTMYGVKFRDTSARIADFAQPMLLIDGKGTGPAQDMIRFVNESPIMTRIDDFTRDIRITGDAAIDLGLKIPLRALNEVKVTGAVDFPGNKVRLDLPLPVFENVKGRFGFDERAIAFDDLRATMLGEDIRVSASTLVPGDIRIRAHGQLGARSVQFLLRHPLTRALEGSARFDAEVRVTNGVPKVSVQSDLVGMSSRLPAPFSKAAAPPMALDVQTRSRSLAGNRVAQAQGGGYDADRLSVRLGSHLAMEIDRDRLPAVAARPPVPASGAPETAGPPDAPTSAGRFEAEPMKIRRAGLLIAPDASGKLAVVMPQQGFGVSVKDALVDFDAWQPWLMAEPAEQPPADESIEHKELRERLAGDFVWRPQRVSVDSAVFRVAGRNLHDVKLDARSPNAKNSGDWTIDLQSREAAGQVLLHEVANPASAGKTLSRIQARFTRVEIARERVAEVQELVSQPVTPEKALPELDIEVGALKFGDARLGSVKLLAGQDSRDPRAWRLQSLELAQDAATFSATGLSVPGGGTDLQFAMKIADCAGLLEHLGQADLIKGCAGQIDGALSWDGSALSPNAATLRGLLAWNFGRGQFLKIKPGLANGLSKLLGVFNLQFLPRRLSFDFADVFSEGFAFDSVVGTASIVKGLAHTNDFVMKGPTATVRVNGDINVNTERQELHVVVEPELNAGLASLAYAVLSNPVVGIGSLLGQWVLKIPIQKFFQFELAVAGSWEDPQVSKLAAPVRSEAGTPILQ